MGKRKSPQDFRVLLVYPNLSMMLAPSLSIALFTGILKKAGYTVDLFDTTHYVNEFTSSPEKRVKYLQARPFSPEKDLGVKPKTNMIGDFVAIVDSFKPDLMVVSVTEDVFKQALALLDSVKEASIPTIVGGIFVTSAPEVVISFPQVRMIGLGEGENTVLAVADRLRTGGAVDDLPGVWVKRDDGTIIRNSQGQLVNLDEVVMPDYSLFPRSRFMRPMGGRIFKTVPLETYRGCPYQCTFCNSPTQVRFARESAQGIFLRRKSIERVRQEILHLIKSYQPEYFLIIDDTFLARPMEEIRAFVEMYKEFKIPFWFNTRPETITAEKLELLRAVNCDRISIGLEHGNEEFRRKFLKRYASNEQILKAFGELARGGIAFSVNSIIGFPGETRELIFETIEFNRQVRGYDALTCSIFTPYHGTELRQMAIDMGYLEPNVFTTHTTSISLLRMPHLTSEQIDGLMRTFTMYVGFPKELWPQIRIAEELTEEGERVFAELSELYKKVFFKSDQKAQKPDWEEVFGYMSKTQMR